MAVRPIEFQNIQDIVPAEPQLPNCGNTCWLNSSIYATYFIPEFREFIINHTQPASARDALFIAPTLSSIYNFLKTEKRGKYGRGYPINGIKIDDLMDGIINNFREVYGEDNIRPKGQTSDAVEGLKYFFSLLACFNNNLDEKVKKSLNYLTGHCNNVDDAFDRYINLDIDLDNNQQYFFLKNYFKYSFNGSDSIDKITLAHNFFILERPISLQDYVDLYLIQQSQDYIFLQTKQSRYGSEIGSEKINITDYHDIIYVNNKKYFLHGYIKNVPNHYYYKQLIRNNRNSDVNGWYIYNDSNYHYSTDGRVKHTEFPIQEHNYDGDTEISIDPYIIILRRIKDDERQIILKNKIIDIPREITHDSLKNGYELNFKYTPMIEAKNNEKNEENKKETLKRIVPLLKERIATINKLKRENKFTEEEKRKLLSSLRDIINSIIENDSNGIYAYDIQEGLRTIESIENERPEAQIPQQKPVVKPQQKPIIQSIKVIDDNVKKLMAYNFSEEDAIYLLNRWEELKAAGLINSKNDIIKLAMKEDTTNLKQSIINITNMKFNELNNRKANLEAEARRKEEIEKLEKERRAKLEADARRKTEIEEANRRAKLEEEAKRKAREDKLRLEAEAKRKAQVEEANRRAKLEAEARRKAQVEEANRRAKLEEEARRKPAEVFTFNRMEQVRIREGITFINVSKLDENNKELPKQSIDLKEINNYKIFFWRKIDENICEVNVNNNIGQFIGKWRININDIVKK